MSENADGRRGMPGLIYPDEALRRLASELAEHYSGVFSAETIERYVLESYTALLRTAKVRAHLLSFTARFASDRLAALAMATGAIERSRPQVLYVCEQNAGRSQMAAALTALLSGGRVDVRSAGSMPAGSLSPVVVEAMAEIGVDISDEFPKPLTDDVVQAADVVVTMGCGDACPVYPGKQYRDWELVDPAGKSIDEVRTIRDEIRANVEDMLRALGVEIETVTA